MRHQYDLFGASFRPFVMSLLDFGGMELLFEGQLYNHSC